MDHSDLDMDARELLRRFVRQRAELGDGFWQAPTAREPATDPPTATRNLEQHENRSERRASASPPEQRTADNVPQQRTTGIIVSNEAPDLFTGDRAEEWEGMSLEEFGKAISGCMKCPLGKSRTNFVFGEGSPAADLMFIGEAPGENEDLQGRPFVGRAGQLLTKMINAMGLAREDVYIANVLKCRPPSNRNPKPEEEAECRPYLDHQIELIKPKVICLLGLVASRTLLNTTKSLKALREEHHEYQGIKVLVTYHPAALLRNPNNKRPTWEDLKQVRYELDGTKL